MAAPLTPPAGELAPPLSMPTLFQPSTVDTGVCARTAGATALPEIQIEVPLAAGSPSTGPSTGPAAGSSPSAGPSSPAGGTLAGRVVIPPGRGAVVEALASPGAPGGTLCLVTDLGIRYALPHAEVLGMLGYAGVAPVPMPAGPVALLPAGRALDPAAARTPAQAAAR